VNISHFVCIVPLYGSSNTTANCCYSWPLTTKHVRPSETEASVSILHMSRNSPEQSLNQLHKLLQSALVFVYATLSNLHSVYLSDFPVESSSNPNINNGLGVAGCVKLSVKLRESRSTEEKAKALVH
jgi:hypothetical protein